MKQYWKHLLSLVIAGTAIVALAQVPASFVRSGMLLSAGATTPITAAAYNSGSQSWAANSQVALTFDTNEWDTASIHSTSMNPSRFTAPTTGYYLVSGWINITSFAAGNFISFQVFVNGSAPLGQPISATAGPGQSQSLTCMLRLTAGDYVEFMGYSNPSAPTTTAGAVGGQMTLFSQ